MTNTAKTELLGYRKIRGLVAVPLLAVALSACAGDYMFRGLGNGLGNYYSAGSTFYSAPYSGVSSYSSYRTSSSRSSYSSGCGSQQIYCLQTGAPYSPSTGSNRSSTPSTNYYGGGYAGAVR